MLVHLFRPFPGGAAEAVYRLCTGLVKRGHEVIVYTANSYRGTRAFADETVDGIRVRRFSRVLPDFVVLGRSFLNPLGILRDLKATSPDVVHLHGLGLLGNDFACLLHVGSPVVITGHGPGFSYDPARPRLLHSVWNAYMRVLGRRLLLQAQSVVAVTPEEIPTWVGWGVPEEKICVVPWGIPEDCFCPRDASGFRKRHDLQGPVLLFAGALHRFKGPQRLLHTLPGILRSFPTAVAVFCGPDVGGAASLVSLARRLGVQNHARFLGYVDRETLLDAYAACDVFVLPSNYEAFGLSLVEAMAFGKPVVASKVGGVPSVVEHGSNGFLVRPDDVEGLRHGITTILEDEILRREFGERSKMLSERYSWSVAVQRYEGLYLHAVGQHG